MHVQHVWDFMTPLSTFSETLEYAEELNKKKAFLLVLLS